jgi:hypothetical protein
VEFKRLIAEQVPVWVASVDAEKHEYHPPLSERDLRESFDVLKGYLVEYRGVSLERLPIILATGVDVEPPTHPIFVCDDLDKAWEYGGLPKVVMAYDGMQLKSTYKQVVVADTTSDELAKLMSDYPTHIESPAGDRIWFTRFPGHTRPGFAYEREYARWIPGDPFDALRAVFVFIPAGFSELDVMRASTGPVTA